MDFSHISNHELLCDVRSLVGEERATTAKLVAYLGEVEDRRLHLIAGFASMFAFCTRELGMSENAAFRRLVAARLGRRFPVVHGLLASGAVHLSALELVREHLTDENHVELLDAVAGKSKSEILAVLATRFPKPDVPTTIRELPPSLHDAGSNEPRALTTTLLVPELEHAASPAAGASRRGLIEPLSATRYEVKFTVTAELREKLELCRDLMSHANPTRELGAVVERAVDLLLAELERKRLGRTKRRPEAVAKREQTSETVAKLAQPREPVPKREQRADHGAELGQRAKGDAKVGRISSATRRRVFERDGMQCTYVSSDGRRCQARAFLELDHVNPRALGGTADDENLRVRCRAHNQLSAEQVFGREYIDSCRHFVRQKSVRRRAGDQAGNVWTTPPRHDNSPSSTKSAALAKFEGTSSENKCPAATRTTRTPSVSERLISALQGLGVRAVEARTAATHVASLHEDFEMLPIEQTLREALHAATPAATRSSR